MSKLYLLGMSEERQPGRRTRVMLDARQQWRKSNRLVRAICREREKGASNRALRLVLDIHLILSSAGLSKKSGWGSLEIGG